MVTMKSIELVQLCVAFFAIALALFFSVITMGVMSINRSVMLALLYITITIVTVDEFVLTWRWKIRFAIPKPDSRERMKLSNYNTCACFLFFVGVVLLVANLASGAAHSGLDDVGPIHVKGTLLDGFTILAVIHYCSLRSYLTWKIVSELVNKNLFRGRQAMTGAVVVMAVCFLIGVILNVHRPSGLVVPEFVFLVPGFFIPVVVCIFRLATNQELNDRRITPGDTPALSVHPWPQEAPTMWVGGSTANWVQPAQQ